MIEAFIRAVSDDWCFKPEREAFQTLYRGVRTMTLKEIDALCADGLLGILPLDLLIGLLTVTYWLRAQLPSRPRVAEIARRYAEARGMGEAEIARLFRGLV